MTQGADIYHLQCLDSEKDARQIRLAEVKAALKDDRALKQAHQALENAQALIQKWTTRQRDLELEIQGISNKITRSEQRLYGGTVKNPKELTDLQAEIASLHRRRQTLEDDLLEVMIEREEAEDTHAQAQKHLDETQTHWTDQQSNLSSEQEMLQEKLAEIEQAITNVLPKIDATDLATYQNLRRRKDGLAVAQTSGDACVCGMAISPNLKWQLRETGMGYCDNCERIIVYAK
jgi:predicted  nucleic acid-binding Zn-ribbon protein